MVTEAKNEPSVDAPPMGLLKSLYVVDVLCIFHSNPIDIFVEIFKSPLSKSPACAYVQVVVVRRLIGSSSTFYYVVKVPNYQDACCLDDLQSNTVFLRG